jgi:[protein-PII] uridylyltransferase
VAHETQPPFTKYKPLLEKIQRTHLLYLAILLHDTGRAQNSRNHSSSGAANADKVSRRLHLPPEEASTLRFLVESHLAMADTARSRNLEDDETIIRFARLVQTRERLDMLMLLSFADHEGTGTQPTSTDWFELVMWRLYNRTSQWLAESSGSRRAEEKSTDALRVKIRQKLTGAVPEIEVDAHFDNLPSRYFAMLPSALIESHIRLIHAFLVQQISSPDSALLPVVAWEDPSAAAYSEVSIVTWDREKLFSRITGSFAACDLNILSADIFTRTDHIVVDTFRVANARGEAVTNPRDRQVFKTIVEHALSKTDFSFHGLLEKKRPGPLGLEGLRFPTRITFDLGTSSRYTILDIQTPDRPGLLYDISSVLADCGVNIDCARIATEKGAALDTFYLRGIDGHKITNSELLNDLSARLRSRLES